MHDAWSDDDIHMALILMGENMIPLTNSHSYPFCDLHDMKLRPEHKIVLNDNLIVDKR